MHCWVYEMGVEQALSNSSWWLDARVGVEPSPDLEVEVASFCAVDSAVRCDGENLGLNTRWLLSFVRLGPERLESQHVSGPPGEGEQVGSQTDTPPLASFALAGEHFQGFLLACPIGTVSGVRTATDDVYSRGSLKVILRSAILRLTTLPAMKHPSHDQDEWTELNHWFKTSSTDWSKLVSK